MNLIQYLYIILGIIYIAFGFFILYKNIGKVKFSFGILTITTGFWIISIAALMVAQSSNAIMIAVKSAFAIAPIGILSYVYFSCHFPVEIKIPRISNLINVAALILIEILVLLPGPILGNFNPAGANVREKAPEGPLFPIFVLLLVIWISISLWNLFKSYREAQGVRRLQLAYIFISTALYIGLTIFVALVLPLFRVYDYISLTPLFSLFLIGGLAYSILKYRLFEIEFLIKRTSVYVVLMGFVVSIYAFVLMLPYNFIGSPGSVRSILVMIIAALIMTITIQPLRNWIDSVTDRIFFQKKYNYEKILEKISKQLNSIVKLEDAYEAVVEPFHNDMHLKGVAIYMRQKAGDENYVCQTREGLIAKALPDKVDENNPLVNYLNQIQTYLEPGEFKYQYGHLYADGDVKDVEKSWIQYEMDNTFQAGLFMPLLLKENMIGFIVLGEKMSGDQFTHRDLSLIETIASQLVTAMDNIRLYDQMLNNERLTIIGTMSASIAHEIRNPLASIKTFIQMLKDKHDKPEFMEKFDQIVPAEIERIAGITADLLNFSKPSSPSLQEVNIANIIERVAALLAAQLRKRQIKLEKDLNDELTIQADSQQLFQVFLNIMLNAMQASPKETSIKVSTQVKTINHPYDDFTESVVYVDFEDQGEGIKKKDLENIFQPFVTSKTEGTGLGLATCKRIIDAHRGNIYVDSILGKGTKMSVVLPRELTQEVLDRQS